MIVSIRTVLQELLLMKKQAEISTNSRSFFVHVRAPVWLQAQLEEVQKKVAPDGVHKPDVDHVTLVHVQKALEDYEPDKVHRSLEALRDVGARHDSIDARVQGWAYFDSASKDGKPATALVALIDAPGLERLHTDMARALEIHGFDVSKTHSMVPHLTIAYLPQHGRVEAELPPLEGKFTIDKVHVASRDVHEIPLTGHENMGRKAAMEATKLSPATNFTMSPSALRQDHREAPGKGETSAVAGPATLQTGAMHSGGGFK